MAGLSNGVSSPLEPKKQTGNRKHWKKKKGEGHEEKPTKLTANAAVEFCLGAKDDGKTQTVFAIWN